MLVNQVLIEDTFAEAFDMTATRLIVTADDANWANHAATTMTGFATSVIGCGVEAGIERQLSVDETPDGRPGVSILLFSVSGKELEKQVVRRVGQCVLTCPSTSIFGGIDGIGGIRGIDGNGGIRNTERSPASQSGHNEPQPRNETLASSVIEEKRIEMGAQLRYFGDGFQISKVIGRERFWRIPVMDGEFVCQDTVRRCGAVGGGNFLVMGRSLRGVLDACQAAIEAIRKLPCVITPFPGGVVRSGSKVGSKYKMLSASTNDAYCPTLRDLPHSKIPDGVESLLEIVIDGLTPLDVSAAMRVGIRTVCDVGPECQVVQVTAGNYGGKLGKHHFHLHELFRSEN